MEHYDPRLDPNSPDFNWQALADHNEDKIAADIAAHDEEEAHRSDDIQEAFARDERMQVADQFVKNRIKARSYFYGSTKRQDDDYTFDDELRYAGLE